MGLLITSLLTLGAAAIAPAAEADPTPASSSTTPTVTADALPTVQINGVVWDQVIAGNTVFAGGQFSSARPAGYAPGGHETPRADLLAYDLTTGDLNTDFNPTLDGQVKALAVSPDGKTLYVGGDFTKVNNSSRNGLAAFDIGSGSLLAWAPAANGEVESIVPTAKAVYLSGAFTSLGNVTRKYIGAVATTTGALLAWAPAVDAAVRTMTATPAGDKLIIGGVFQTVNGTPSPGMAALDPSTGATVSWQALKVIKNADSAHNLGIYKLAHDSDTVYGTGWDFSGTTPGLEGAFAARPSDGALVWIADCHGDTYSVFSNGNAVYTGSHHHDCSNIGGFSDGNGYSPGGVTRANAYAKTQTGVVQQNHVHKVYYQNFGGQPATSLLHWYPDINAGTYTNTGQGTWTVTGTSDGRYVLYGGEFTTVNGIPQQGLVRFARLGVDGGQVAPDKSAALRPTVSLVNGQVTVSWTGTFDKDSERLTYLLFRGTDQTHPVAVASATSLWYDLPTFSVVDATAPPGQTASYSVAVLDAQGNRVDTAATSAAIPGSATAPASHPPAPAYTSTQSGLSLSLSGAASADPNGVIAKFAWNFGDGATATGPAVTHTFSRAATYPVTLTVTDDRGLSRSYSTRISMGGNASPVAAFTSTLTGLTAGLNATGSSDPDGSIASYAWDFGDGSTGTGATATHTYAAPGVYPVTLTVTDPAGAISTQVALITSGTPPTAAFSTQRTGLTLRADGSASHDADNNAAARWNWDFGDGTTGTGVIGQHTYSRAGAYQVTLTVTDSSGLAAATTTAVQVVDIPPTPRFSSAVSGHTVSVNGSGSTDADGTVTGWIWNFGDGTTANGATATHTYAKYGSYKISLTAVDNAGWMSTTTTSVTTANTPPTASAKVATARLKATFDASAAKDSDGQIVSYAWNFGDHGSGTGRTISHTYRQAGSYRVTLTVKDNGGATAVWTTTVKVS